MQFTPRSQEEIMKEMGKLSIGEGTFFVKEAEETVSKAGNDMIKVKLQVWDKNGDSAHVFDYLLSNVHWKLKRFCDSAGITDKYDLGNLKPEDILNIEGKCKLKYEDYNDNEYLKVGDYLKKKDGEEIKSFKSKEPEKTVGDDIDADIPF